MELSAPARRVLGALIEKAMATPQGYPLSLNALRTACNQTTNRDPVVNHDDIVVNDAVKELRALGLAKAEYAARSNTPKYAHLLDDYFELNPAQTALMGVLLLRGPQTVGELRQRTDRMHSFADLGEVHQALHDLGTHIHGALVVELARQPGQKETRWIHLLGDDGDDADVSAAAPSTDAWSTTSATTPASGAPPLAQVNDLVEEVEALRDDLETLRIEVERLRRVVQPGSD